MTIAHTRGKFPWRRIIILFFLTWIPISLIFHQQILVHIGHFLVFRQQPQTADVIVVLNGRDMERSLFAVDLYKQGYADLIVLSRGSQPPLLHEFWRRVGSNFDKKIFFQRAVEAMGVPHRSFKLIGSGVNSTFDEANVTKKFMLENDYHSMLLVTSKWHSKRAYLTFRSVLNNNSDISITICPSEYDGFDANGWWQNEVDAESVFREYVRLFYYLVSLRIRFTSLFSR